MGDAASFSTIRRRALAAAVATMLAPATAEAQDSAFTPEQRLEIERIVEEVIVGRMTASGGGPAPESAELIDATDPERLVGIASLYGAASLIDDVHGNPLLQGRIETVTYELYFYGCENARDCKNVMFRAVWMENGASPEDVMRWNREKRFGKAYIDRRGQLVVEMNVNLDYGVSIENMVDTFDWWRVVLEDFVLFFSLG